MSGARTGITRSTVPRSSAPTRPGTGGDSHAPPRSPASPGLFPREEFPLKEGIEGAARLLGAARRAAALTGAGVSAESGVPTFRGEGGLWRRYRAEDLATPGAYARDPELVWEWYRHRRRLVAACEPNAAHLALARLERLLPSFTLITQNVDGLHARAGSRDPVELHGNLFRARCESDGETRTADGSEGDGIPRCRAGHPMRPDVVWFGEMLPEEALRRAHDAAVAADLFLVVGTSALVHPAATLPVLAQQSGARLVEINPEETGLSGYADISLRGKAAEILPALVELAFPEAREGGEG
ncbi:MAG: NAD-dependent deacylase [Candidatus Eisenbacteria bacterium]|nr:NAD-dependent deacylase [Candidatus Eisenbacteria bacterium]